MEPELRCDNCGIRIHWQATLIDGRAYCCLGCAEGGPCLCDYDNLPQADKERPIVRRKGPGHRAYAPGRTGLGEPD